MLTGHRGFRSEKVLFPRLLQVSRSITALRLHERRKLTQWPTPHGRRLKGYPYCGKDIRDRKTKINPKETPFQRNFRKIAKKEGATRSFLKLFCNFAQNTVPCTQSMRERVMYPTFCKKWHNSQFLQQSPKGQKKEDYLTINLILTL